MSTHTNAQHTPGPWTHTPGQDTVWANDGDTKVAKIEDLPWITLASGRRTSDSATEEANARLIAAAPELLAIAEALARWEADPDHFGGDLADIATKARAAIAKARSQ